MTARDLKLYMPIHRLLGQGPVLPDLFPYTEACALMELSTPNVAAATVKENEFYDNTEKFLQAGLTVPVRGEFGVEVTDIGPSFKFKKLAT